MIRHLIAGFLLLQMVSSFAQEAGTNLRIGQWRSHLPYNRGLLVTQSDSVVFFATELSLLTLDKEDFAVDFISKVDGLSNVGVRLIEYHRPTSSLIVVYNNSVIDLLAEHGTTTFNQIKNFSNIVGEKTIYSIFIGDNSDIYLAANYGISKLNLARQEFVFTTFTGIDVQDVVIFNGDIYAATEEGIYRTATDNQAPEDFSSWQLLSDVDGFPFDYSTKAMVRYDDDLYLDINDDLYQLRADRSLHFVHAEPGHELRYLSAAGANLLVGYHCCGPTDFNTGKILYFNPDHTFGQVAQDCVGQVRDAVQDQQGRIFFADDGNDFRMIDDATDPACETFSFNSPWSKNNREIAVLNNEVWITAGGVNQTFSNNFSRSGFYSFIDGQWTNYNPFNREELKGENPDDNGDDLLDFITIAIHPLNGTVYAGSFFEGLIAFDGQQMTLFNEKNSSLRNAAGDPLRTRVSGLAFDADNNLWISNHSAERPVSVLLTDGSWKNFLPLCNRTQLHQLDVDQNGFKWFVDGSSQSGVIVFDEGNLEDPNDDRCKAFTENNSNLPTNITNCLAVDLDGEVWVGTTQGIIIFECRTDAFDDRCQGSLRGFTEGGFTELLLKTQEIQTIAIDGANRKWIGTKNGIFVLSSTGDEEVNRFTTDNSPLFDNNIIDIAINQENGEVFIGTNSGVISLQSDAVAGGRLHKSNILVFPNPVEPEYFGPIAIRGLARDADVKITDINGKLVFETQALGGQAIWDGNDYNGRRVNSGVYLVFSSATNPNQAFTSTRPDAAVAKILVMN